jgi:hypothetical protein
VKMKWKTCYGLKTLLRANQLPQFFNNFRVDMVDFVNSHKVNIKRNAFWTLTSAWNEGEKKIKSWKKREKKIKSFPNPFTCQSHIFYIGPLNWTPSL